MFVNVILQPINSAVVINQERSDYYFVIRSKCGWRKF